jgi:ribonuclease P protein subunit POP4
MGYMSELLGLPQQAASTSPTIQMMPSSANMHPKLVKADFHGSIMTGMAHQTQLRNLPLTCSLTVRQSKNPCLVGLSGIVVHETENAFKIITPQDQFKRMS